MCNHLPSRWGRCWILSFTSFHLRLSWSGVNRLHGRRGTMHTAGTRACYAMFVHPVSPGKKRVVKERGGRGNRKFFHLTCHYVAASRCYLNLLTNVTAPVQHTPFIWGVYLCTLNSHNEILKLLTCELMSQHSFFFFYFWLGLVWFFSKHDNIKKQRKKKKVNFQEKLGGKTPSDGNDQLQKWY